MFCHVSLMPKDGKRYIHLLKMDMFNFFSPFLIIYATNDISMQLL